MKGWDYEHFQKILDGFLGSQDLDDPKVVKRQKILEAATALFIHHGYRKTSISDVAERALVAWAESADAACALVLQYLNRLSDLLFALARLANHDAGLADTPWRPRRP